MFSQSSCRLVSFFITQKKTPHLIVCRCLISLSDKHFFGEAWEVGQRSLLKFLLQLVLSEASKTKKNAFKIYVALQ